MQTANETDTPQIAPKRGRGRPPKGQVVDYSTYPEKLANHRLKIKQWRIDNPEKYQKIIHRSYERNKELRSIKSLESKLENAIRIRKEKTLLLISNHLLNARDKLSEPEPATDNESSSD